MGISQQIGASSLSKPGVCTSSTRPATPYEGQMIYETDTDKVLVYNGSAWYANWNTAWGIVDTTSGGTSSRGFYNKTDANFTLPLFASIAQVTGFTMTFTPVTGRLYKASYVVRADITTAQLVYSEFRIGATRYAARADSVVAGGNDTIINYNIFTGLTASTTIQVFAAVSAVSAGSLLVFDAAAIGNFCIEDIGAA